MNKLLILCTGNICRSPMAAALLSEVLPTMKVVSAGLAASVGLPADPLAQDLMGSRGIDISSHRAQQVTTSMLRAADLILVMSSGQQRKLASLYPGGRGKVARLCQFSGLDISDPYGGDEQAFRDALQLIETGVTQWTERLTRLTQKMHAQSVA